MEPRVKTFLKPPRQIVELIVSTLIKFLRIFQLLNVPVSLLGFHLALSLFPGRRLI